jgi:protein required for attachment to host cells
VLGALRARLSDEVAERVVGEVPKVLTNHPVERLGEIVVRALDPA